VRCCRASRWLLPPMCTCVCVCVRVCVCVCVCMHVCLHVAYIDVCVYVYTYTHTHTHTFTRTHLAEPERVIIPGGSCASAGSCVFAGVAGSACVAVGGPPFPPALRIRLRSRAVLPPIYKQKKKSEIRAPSPPSPPPPFPPVSLSL
jgi:hypothetical protein